MEAKELLDSINQITIQAQIGFGLAVVAFLLVLKFFVKFPEKKPSKK